jgi:hypothetical protein
LAASGRPLDALLPLASCLRELNLRFPRDLDTRQFSTSEVTILGALVALQSLSFETYGHVHDDHLRACEGGDNDDDVDDERDAAETTRVAADVADVLELVAKLPHLRSLALGAFYPYTPRLLQQIGLRCPQLENLSVWAQLDIDALAAMATPFFPALLSLSYWSLHNNPDEIYRM